MSGLYPDKVGSLGDPVFVSTSTGEVPWEACPCSLVPRHVDPAVLKWDLPNYGRAPVGLEHGAPYLIGEPSTVSQVQGPS